MNQIWLQQKKRRTDLLGKSNVIYKWIPPSAKIASYINLFGIIKVSTYSLYVATKLGSLISHFRKDVMGTLTWNIPAEKREKNKIMLEKIFRLFLLFFMKKRMFVCPQPLPTAQGIQIKDNKIKFLSKKFLCVEARKMSVEKKQLSIVSTCTGSEQILLLIKKWYFCGVI